MSPRAKWIWGIGGVVVTALLAWVVTHMLGLAEFGGSDSEITADIAQGGEDPSAVLCSSQATADAIGAQVFARARQASQDAEALRRLEADSIVRLDRPELTEYIEARDLAECNARLVIELPRGTETAFGYSRRLRAEIDYVVRGGSGAIDRLERADMIITDLSAADLSIREHDEDDRYSDEKDPIGALIDDIVPETESSPPAQRPRRQGPPAEGDPVDLLPPEMEGARRER